MTSIKYTPLPFEDKDEHVIEMAKSDLFDFSSTFDFGIKDSKSMFKSAFKYSNWNPNLSNAVEIGKYIYCLDHICTIYYDYPDIIYICKGYKFMAKAKQNLLV